MRYLKKFLFIINNMKIRKKLILIYVIVMLIPVLMVGIYLTNSMRNMVMERAINEACINTDRIQDRLNEVIRKATDVSDRLYIDKKLQDMVMTDYKDVWQVTSDYYDYSAFDDYMRFYKEIDSIRFYVTNETMLDNSRFIKATKDILDSDWYQSAVVESGRIIWKYHYDEISTQKCLSLIRAVKVDNRNIIGVLVVNVSDQYLHSIIKDEPFDTIAFIDSGKIVMSSDHDIQGTDISTNIAAESDTLIHNTRSSTVYNDKASITITNSFLPEKTSSKFTIVSILPVGSIVSKANKASSTGFTIIGISLIISISLIIYFSKVFSKRIIMLRREMHKVVTGNFDISKGIEGSDEVGELYEDLNIMIDSIQQLIHEVYEEKLQKEQLSNRQREVEFKMLASQINPHFLYNTLETIRMKAHCNKQVEIANIVKMLAKLMRRNLEVSDKLVTLESEIELVKSYLEIQKFRFGERVSYKINVSCDIQKYEVLPLLLQPVVENAFVHGLEGKEGQGSIIINVEEKESCLRIAVSDDGLGIREQELEELENKLNNFAGSGKKSIGLSNVNQRIKLFYGENYQVKLTSHFGEGTTVALCLPLKKESVAIV